MPRWATRQLPADPDRDSPSGATQIRLLPSFEEGEIVHATARPDKPSIPATLTGVGEFFYVLEGQGRLWRATGDLEHVVTLTPDRFVSIPPGIEYQYRADSVPMRFLVTTVPRWEERNWARGTRHFWADDGKEATRTRLRPGPWVTKDLPSSYDYLAPDGSEIRLLPTCDAGGLAHCRLPAAAVTAAVRHRTVKEVWYVLAGRGQVWRSDGVDDEVVDVDPGKCLTIPTGVGFQFRAANSGPLEIMIGTFPAWPGASEAEHTAGPWPASH